MIKKLRDFMLKVGLGELGMGRLLSKKDVLLNGSSHSCERFVNTTGASKMLDFSRLEDFSGSLKAKQVPWYEPSEMSTFLSQKDRVLWLDSGPSGARIILLGEKWSLEGNPEEWKFSSSAKEQTFKRSDVDGYAQTLNEIEEVWLKRQPDHVMLGLLVGYDGGWDWEKRRQIKKHKLPEMTIFCPKSILVYDKYGETGRLWGEELNKSDSRKKNSHQYAKGVELMPAESKEVYLKKIAQVKTEIREGRSFQVNLSQEIQGQGNVNSLSWATKLFESEAMPYAAYYRNANTAIVSNSPERLIFKGEGGNLITRPIAGTLARKDEASDAKRLDQFCAHVKELAEHNMLIDLERNDLGKISEAGSVKIVEHLCLEKYTHLYHLTSEICGKLRVDMKSGDVLKAMFPGGTITGCPKLETMHIIDRLEEKSRGPYCGSLGYLRADGRMDLNILIRSAWVNDDTISFRVGGGIVWESSPEREYLETLTKAKTLIKSLLEGGAEIDSNHRSFRQFFT